MFKYSELKRFYVNTNNNVIKELKSICNNTLVSEYGWVYLINDTNNFIEYLYGEKFWNDEQINTARNVLHERKKYLKKKNIKYYKIIIPEKSVVYKEYLPKVFDGMIQNNSRPARHLCYLDDIFYLDKYLIDAKSYGQLYFRADTHTNWLGSFFVYLYISELLIRRGFTTIRKLSISDLMPEIASYEGDLYVQMKKEDIGIYRTIWKDVNQIKFLNYLLKYSLRNEKKESYLVQNRPYLEKYCKDRPLFVYESDKKFLPTCVVFRDSTSDHLIEYLSECFSRVVY